MDGCGLFHRNYGMVVDGLGTLVYCYYYDDDWADMSDRYFLDDVGRFDGTGMLDGVGMPDGVGMLDDVVDGHLRWPWLVDLGVGATYMEGEVDLH